MTEEFFVVASTEELADDEQLRVELNGEEILLCFHEGQYYAVSYYCSHAAFSLEGGLMRDECITCPYHGAMFNLKDGSVEAPPAFEGIKVYPVKVESNTIAISVSNQN